MFTRVRLAGVVFLLLLACATVSFAQQSDSSMTARSGARPGRGAVGAQVGGAWILSGADYSKGAQPRMSFEGSYRFMAAPKWRWQVSPYFAWNSYRTGSELGFTDPNFPTSTTKDFMVTQVAGGNAQIQRVGGRGNWNWHVGAGPALYRVMVQNHQKVLKDPVSKELHRGLYLGATVEYGIERFLKSLPNTSLEWTAAYQTAFAKNDTKFPSGFNGMPGLIEIRFGGHYYFDFKAPKKPGGVPGGPRH